MKVDSPVPGANCSCQVSSLSWRLASTFFNTAKARLRGFSSIERKKWPLVLLHGNGSMIEDFQSSGLIDLAAKKYRVIAVDRPGFGHSDRPRSTIWTPEAQADLIAAALKKISVQRAIVLGHSWGDISGAPSGREISARGRGPGSCIRLLLPERSSRCGDPIAAGHTGDR